MMWQLLLSLLLVKESWQQKDPLNSFCRRFGHQSTIVDRKLYIDGGLVDWNPIAQNPANYSNTWLLYNDLNTSPAGVGVPQLHANLSKNATIPDVSGGVLWPDAVNKRFYLYGGDYNGVTPNSPNLASYDILYDNWDFFGPPSQLISSVSWAGGVGVSELGMGFTLGGWLSNNSVPGWSGAPLATSTLIQYNMDTGVWTNNTGPDTTPRAEGVMVYLPASNNGLLVYFGGITTPYNNNTMVPSPMSTIHVYDIQSSKWYTQTATGNVPLSRRRFCAGATWAPDYSSYNIYLYGGLGFGANETGFDDVYILTLPSFTWIQWWPTSPGQGNPHHSLTCSVVNNAQMLVIGGTFPLSDDCDSPETWGTHNLDLGQQNSAGKMWNEYQPNLTSYVVPTAIISVVGGSSLGGATATAPAAGFDDRDLSVYFTQHASVAARSPTRAIPSPTATRIGSPQKIPVGAIIGIAVGGAVLVVAIFTGCCCLTRRRKRRQNTPNAAANGPAAYNSWPTTQYIPDQAYAGPQYQLPTNPPPAELGSNPPMHHVDPKDAVYNQVQETPGSFYANYDRVPSRHQSPIHSPQPSYHSPTHSPHPSSFSSPTELQNSPVNNIYASQHSPTPTYSSLGRPPRKPIPHNDHFY